MSSVSHLEESFILSNGESLGSSIEGKLTSVDGPLVKSFQKSPHCQIGIISGVNQIRFKTFFFKETLPEMLTKLEVTGAKIASLPL